MNRDGDNVSCIRAVACNERALLCIELSGSVITPSLLEPNLDTYFDLPQGANVSLFQEPTTEKGFRFDAGWTNWSHFDFQPLTIGPITVGGERDWSDTTRVMTGAAFRSARSMTSERGRFSA